LLVLQWPLITQSEPDVEVAPDDIVDAERDVVSPDERASIEEETVELDDEVNVETDEKEVAMTISLFSKADVDAQQNSSRFDTMTTEITVTCGARSMVVTHVTETDSVTIVAQEVEHEVDGDGQELAVGCVW
jgi:hypothetical protein